MKRCGIYIDWSGPNAQVSLLADPAHQQRLVLAPAVDQDNLQERYCRRHRAQRGTGDKQNCGATPLECVQATPFEVVPRACNWLEPASRRSIPSIPVLICRCRYVPTLTGRRDVSSNASRTMRIQVPELNSSFLFIDAGSFGAGLWDVNLTLFDF